MKNFRAPSLEKLTGDMRLDDNTAKCVRAVWRMNLEVDLSIEVVESIKNQLDAVWLGKAGTKNKDIICTNQRAAIFNWLDWAQKNYFRAPAPRELKRQIISQLCRGHGVEYLGIGLKSGLHVYYINMGDTYTPTIIFNGKNAFISTFGDVVENGFVKGLEYAK